MKDKISIVSNVWMRQVELEHKGDSVGGHSHTFDHQHLLCVGSVSVKIGSGAERVFHAPQMIFIPKNEKHNFTALTDKTLGFCIHPIRNGKRVEDIISEDMKVEGMVNLINKQSMDLFDVGETPAVPWNGDE